MKNIIITILIFSFLFVIEAYTEELKYTQYSRSWVVAYKGKCEKISEPVFAVHIRNEDQSEFTTMDIVCTQSGRESKISIIVDFGPNELFEKKYKPHKIQMIPYPTEAMFIASIKWNKPDGKLATYFIPAQQGCPHQNNR